MIKKYVIAFCLWLVFAGAASAFTASVPFPYAKGWDAKTIEVAFRGGLTTDQPPAQFQSVAKIGGGGWNVGADICTDGTRYVRTDSYGAYLWDGVSRWSQLVNQTSMPAANFGYTGTGTSQINQAKAGGGGPGVYEITSAPSACATVYMMSNGWILKSTNRGAPWTNISSLTGVAGTSFGGQTTAVPMASNSAPRTGGRKMAVDPLNANVVFAGTDSLGLYVTRDAGASGWTLVSGVPTATTQSCGGSACFPNYNIAFDTSSATITCPTVGGSCTSGIYAYTNGVTAGVYHSTDGGVTWALAATGGPASVQHMVVSSTGTVWACSGLPNTSSTLYRLLTGGAAWSTQSPLCHSVAVNPATPTTVVAANAGGALNITTNADTTTPTWSGNTAITVPFISALPNPPWLASDVGSLSNGDTIFDPSLSNVMMMGEGVGPWITSPQTGTTQWSSIANGIEQMVSRAVIAPNGTAVVGVSDRGTFQLATPTVYPSGYNNASQNSFALTTTNGIDYVSASPLNMASINGDITGAIANNINSGTSSDGGNTWDAFNSGFSYTIAATALSGTTGGGTTGLIRVTVPSTAGLVAWTAGTTARNSIIRLVNFGGAPNTARSYYEITNITATTFDLLNSNYTTALSPTPGSYKVYVDTNPLTNIGGFYSVIGLANSGGLIQVTIANSGQAMSNTLVCLVGVNGTSSANDGNGCWVATASTNGISATFNLLGSTFANSWSSGGFAYKLVPPGGAIAQASPTDIMYVPANEEYPQCTTDGGKTWTQLQLPAPVAITAATYSATNTLTLTLASSAPSQLIAGASFNVSGMVPSAYDGTYVWNAASSGTTLVGTRTFANPGTATTFGTIQPVDVGWVHDVNINSRIAAADRTLTNRFYLFSETRISNSSILYTVDSCSVTASATSTVANGQFTATLLSVPGYAGHLLFSVGSQGTALTTHPGGGALRWTNSPGTNSSWVSITNTSEPLAIGAGAIAPGSDYPTIYMVGWVSNVYGIWRSTSTAAQWAANTVSWTQVGDYPLGSMDNVFTFSGNGQIWNKWYLGFSGSSFTYGQQNFLLKRDLDPSSNDNDPMWTDKAA